MAELSHGNRKLLLHQLRNDGAQHACLVCDLIAGHTIDHTRERLLQAEERRLVDPQHWGQDCIDRRNRSVRAQALKSNNQSSTQFRVCAVQHLDDRHDLAVAQPGEINLMADQFVQ
ncbi:hypothetical protein D3C77_476950 [compost metagenome]